LLVIVAASAHAGKFHAYSCRTPSGQPAPTDGWSASAVGAETRTEDSCSQGGSLVAALGEHARRETNVDLATWAFSAPPWATVASATLWRAGDADGGVGVDAWYALWFAGPKNVNTPADAFGFCVAASGCMAVGNPGQPLAAENRLAVPAANLGGNVYADAGCIGVSEYVCPEGAGDANGYAAVVRVYAADVVLEQNAGPSAGGVGGELALAPVVRGTSYVTFNASDPGSGIYQALFSVDGSVIQVAPVNENGGHCRDVGQSTDGLPAFLYVQPCLTSLTAAVGFDTTKVANGIHHLTVSISDAAGVTTTILDRSVLVENITRGPCNATCDEHALLRPADPLLLRRTFVRRYADSNLTLTGQLVSSAGGVAGAVIELHQHADYPGGRDVLLGTTRTDASGTWRLVVPRGPSRFLTVGFRSHINDPTLAAQIQYRETVRAGVQLSAPRRARPGRTFAFRGALAGGFVPRGGVLVSLEIFYARHWREIALLRSNRRGAFAYRYTFAPIGPATYRFRAQVPQTIGYPFATGTSRSRSIHLTG
jgi:hypothetical protein